MNNEPVAWMYQIHDITGWTWVIDQRLPDYEYRNEKPLYTHPVKEQLTDEEILQVITMSHSWIDGYPKKYALDFARAILKEAQKK